MPQNQRERLRAKSVMYNFMRSTYVRPFLVLGISDSQSLKQNKLVRIRPLLTAWISGKRWIGVHWPHQLSKSCETKTISWSKLANRWESWKKWRTSSAMSLRIRIGSVPTTSSLARHHSILNDPGCLENLIQMWRPQMTASKPPSKKSTMFWRSQKVTAIAVLFWFI